MSLYRRDPVLPEWEPMPWDLAGEAVDEQERGFHARALKPISWTKVPWNDFPPGGLFGHSREYFVSNDVEFFASFEGEDLLLLQHVWNGFPDPPEWGLVSRPSGEHAAPWQGWGHVPDLPTAWTVPTEPGCGSPGRN